MSQVRKRKLNWFLAWNYDSEEESLNEYSERGWRLTEVHTFYKVFVRDENLYRYRIDYRNQCIDYEERNRYIETFEEMGWHYVGAIFNGWQYFEKKVEEGNTEDDYKIYTDNTSLKDTLHRWIRIARIIQVIIFLGCIMNFISYCRGYQASLGLFGTLFIEAALMEFGIISMKRKRIGIKKSRRSNIIVGNLLFFSMIACLVMGITGTINMSGHIALIHTKWQGVFSGDNPGDKLYFVVKDKGWYDINADCTSEYGTIVFTIFEGSDEIFKTSGTSLNISRKIQLDKGAYRAVMSIDYGGGEIPEENFFSMDLKID